VYDLLTSILYLFGTVLSRIKVSQLYAGCAHLTDFFRIFFSVGLFYKGNPKRRVLVKAGRSQVYYGLDLSSKS